MTPGGEVYGPFRDYSTDHWVASSIRNLLHHLELLQKTLNIHYVLPIC